MNKYLGKIIMGVLGSIVILGSCIITKSLAPLWVFIFLPFIICIA